MFDGLLAAVAVAMLAFFQRPDTTTRFSLGVGAFFASVASTYITTTYLPEADVLTLTDIVNGIGMLTIFLTLLSSTISLHLYTGNYQKALWRIFDTVSGMVFVVMYVSNTLVILRAASM